MQLKILNNRISRQEEIDFSYAPSGSTVFQEKHEGKAKHEFGKEWIVIVWNDPVNLMTYVTFVFQKLFGYSKEKATSLMLDVHHKGKAVV
ncbi:MAG: ATP-dependent Clp protease adapter ClpS, partial [Actinomycetota bacterium]|nr:ATP-dependent Clp protease adapter ClpS [Actinomycetota bacterium]